MQKGQEGRHGDATRRLSLTAAAAGTVLYASVPHRLEFAAHVVAGAGLSALALVGVARLGDGRWARTDERLAVAVLAAVLAAAVVAERTFSGPFAVHDVASTVLGGALGVAAVLPVFDAAGERRRLVAVGLTLILAGLVIRYPAQGLATDLWWYGS